MANTFKSQKFCSEKTHFKQTKQNQKPNKQKWNDEKEISHKCILLDYIRFRLKGNNWELREKVAHTGNLTNADLSLKSQKVNIIGFDDQKSVANTSVVNSKRRVGDITEMPYSNTCIYEHWDEQQHLMHTMLQLLKNTQKSINFAYHSQSRLHPSPDGLYLCMSELNCITANRWANTSWLEMQWYLVKTQIAMNREG